MTSPHHSKPAAATRRVVSAAHRSHLRRSSRTAGGGHPYPGRFNTFIVAGEAFDGRSCLERVTAIKPDLLILDVNMPGGGPQLQAPPGK